MKTEIIEKLKELATSYGSLGNARANGVHDGILMVIEEIENNKSQDPHYEDEILEAEN